MSEVRLYVDGLLLAAIGAAPYEAAWDTTMVMDGDHTLLAEAVDTSGNVASTPMRTVTVSNAPPPDAEAPVVALDAPAAPALVSGTVTLSATASDSVGVTELRFRANGNLVAALATPPYTFDWDTASVSDGAYSITAEAVDLAGNSAASPAVVLTVDNTAPTVVTQDPAGGATLDAFPSTLSITFGEAMVVSLFDGTSVTLVASGGDGTGGDDFPTAFAVDGHLPTLASIQSRT